MVSLRDEANVVGFDMSARELPTYRTTLGRQLFLFIQQHAQWRTLDELLTVAEQMRAAHAHPSS